MLLAGISSHSFAQSETLLDPTFHIADHLYRYRFTVALDRGNTMKVDLTDMKGIENFRNIDSLLTVFISDMKPLRDSLGAELQSRRIDYLFGNGPVKKIRISKTDPDAAYYAVKGQDHAAMKMKQDTIYLLMILPKKLPQPGIGRTMAHHIYRVGFLLNDLNDISGYLDGSLNDSIAIIEKEHSGRWALGNNEVFYLKSHPSVTAKGPGGQLYAGTTLSYRLSIDAQNYQNNFVPSISGGLSFIRRSYFAWKEMTVGYESHFFFAKDNAGKLKSFPNGFVTLSYGRARLKGDGSSHGHLSPFISLGYLAQRKGDFYDKHTFKLGIGNVHWGNNRIAIQPVLYFKDFFKQVTPSLRLSVNF